MNKKSLIFLKYWLYGILLTWLILTIGIFIKMGGFKTYLFSNENLPIVIGVYLFAGCVCGLCFAAFMYLIRRNKDNE